MRDKRDDIIRFCCVWAMNVWTLFAWWLKIEEHQATCGLVDLFGAG